MNNLNVCACFYEQPHCISRSAKSKKIFVLISLHLFCGLSSSAKSKTPPLLCPADTGTRCRMEAVRMPSHHDLIPVAALAKRLEQHPPNEVAPKKRRRDPMWLNYFYFRETAWSQTTGTDTSACESISAALQSGIFQQQGRPAQKKKTKKSAR